MRREREVEQALTPKPEVAVRDEFGPLTRALAHRYFDGVRFSPEAEAELRALHERGFVVHVMRTTSWINFLYLAWALVRKGLPPLRAVVNLRRWFAKPWRLTAQRGDFDVRFTYARRQNGAGLIFLRRSALGTARGRALREDPFPALVSLARKGERTVYLVPELFVWDKQSERLRPSPFDYVFGSPEAPGLLASMFAFWRNYRRAQFRVGEPIDLRRFIEQNPDEPDEVIARKVRGALYHHLARESRAVFGAPKKRTERVIEETLRLRTFHKSLEEIARVTGRDLASVQREAKRDLRSIAARLSLTTIALATPVLNWVFNRLYDGIEVDEPGLERALKAGAPLVLCPSHKSHMDYLVMSWVLWRRGYSVPLVAAGANLSFWPLGPFFRRAGAFFLRRSFKGDAVYTAAFRAYVKKLVHDGAQQEFFPEGGRSRTGKLLPAKLGMFTWEVDAVLEGARPDLHFVPVAIDYEKIVESSSYGKELQGGEKKKEDIKSLLAAPKVLTSRYGRIHLSFGTPISVVETLKERKLDPSAEVSEEDKRSLVRAIGNRVMYEISRASTLTPQALVAASLLAHRRRGISSSELTSRIHLLREIAEARGTPMSAALRASPDDPSQPGALRDAIEAFRQDGMVRTEVAKNEEIHLPVDERRTELSFYKNTLMNLMAPRALVASAVLARPDEDDEPSVRERALFLSRLFKVEFIYRVGADFETIFSEVVEELVGLGLLARSDEGGTRRIRVVDARRAEVDFLADLLRDLFESYLLAGLTLADLEKGPLEKKGFVKAALETGRAEFLAGRIGTSESLSRTTLENAVAYMLDQKMLVEQDRKLRLGEPMQDPDARARFVERLRGYLNRRRG